MKDKVLISVASRNSPWFLEHFMESFRRHDPGYAFDLLVINNESDDENTLKLYDKYSKDYLVENRENKGRAQGAYNHAWENHKDYKYYFFLHDDSAILQNNWLKLAVDRINDDSVEPVLKGTGIENFPVGKVGFQAYEWQNRHKYLRTGFRTLFYYLDELIDNILQVKDMPKYYQHINDDKIMYKNEVLRLNNGIWNLEDARKIETSNPELFQKVYNFFDERNLVNKVPFANGNYTIAYHPFEVVSELFADIMAMRQGYRSHCVIGDGYCQEQLGWSSFWGNTHILHYGDHVTFKRLSSILRADENDIRKKFKDKTFLKICYNIVKKDCLR